MKRILSIVILCIVCLHMQSQSKKLWLKYADEAFVKKDYPTAISYYTKVMDDTTVLNELVLPYEAQLVNLKISHLKTDSVKKAPVKTQKEITKADYVNHQLAHAYRLNYDYANAVDYFKQVTDNGSYPNDAYYYGLSLMQIKDYTGAMNVFEKYVGSGSANDSLKKIIQKQVASCYFAQDTASYKQMIHVKMLDTIVFNRGTSNFAPRYWGGPGKLIFTSARPGGVLLDPEKQESRDRKSTRLNSSH